ncbi:MAG: IS1634 family transposase, partial [Campylobacterota bacterium]|nr:IS1634 family transposase [Campylobacterota bacterium]
INPDDMHQDKTVGFSLLLYFIMNLLGMVNAIGKTFQAKLMIVLVVARITLQSSRLQALKWSKRDYILDVVNLSSEEKSKLNDKSIYQGLDYAYDNKEIIEDRLFKSYYKDNPPKKLFYDVTSSYVTGEYNESELVAYGYNRDGKKGTKQIVIGLLCDEQGHAIAVDTYAGNTHDVTTFSNQLDRAKKRFNLDHITIVGDGGMIKSEDIATIKALGYDYITSIGKPSIKKLINDENSQMDISLFDEQLQEFVENDTRYILRQNPIRANEIRNTREQKIERLQEFITMKVEYYNTHYRAKQETLEKHINTKISALKLNSFLSYNISYQEGDITIKDKEGNKTIKTKALATIEIIIDEKAKREIEQLDGCYVVTTSLIDTSKESKEEIHQAYKRLIKVENAFKMLKTEFLEIRPLYLRTDSRIKGHVFISMLAYNIVRKLRAYISLSNYDFKDTIERLKAIATVKVKLTNKVTSTYIPTVDEKIQKLFDSIGFSLPKKVNY